MDIQLRRQEFQRRTKTITTDEFYLTEDKIGKQAEKEFEKKILPLIGQVTVSFNAMESALDFILSDVINKENDEVGWLIIKNLSFSQKLNMVCDIMKVDDEYFNGFNSNVIKQFRLELDHAATIRNRIIHGEWESMTKDNRVKTKMDMGKDGVVFHMTEFTLDQLNDDVDFVDELSHKLWNSFKRPENKSIQD